LDCIPLSIREIMTGHLTSSLIICGKTIGRLPDVLFKSNSDYQTVPSSEMTSVITGFVIVGLTRRRRMQVS
ncbi:MAG: hypothetical protein AAGJ40_16120, partial [Planctomycetota bacterium]